MCVSDEAASWASEVQGKWFWGQLFTWDKWGCMHTFVHGLRNVCGICLFNAKILALWAVVLHPSYAHIFKMYGWIQSELRTMDIKTLEEEHNALLLDKAGVIEYLQTLPSQIEILKVLFYSTENSQIFVTTWSFGKMAYKYCQS